MQLTVKDVISSNDPHTKILYSQLPSMASDLINNIHLNFNDAVKDAYIWNNQKSGAY